MWTQKNKVEQKQTKSIISALLQRKTNSVASKWFVDNRFEKMPILAKTIQSSRSKSVIQCSMNDNELDKLREFLMRYDGRIDNDIMKDLWNHFGAQYDTFDEAVTDLTERINAIVARPDVISDLSDELPAYNYRVNATSYPRVFLAGEDRSTKDHLIAGMEKEQPPKGFDLSYREHVDLIDFELDRFLPKEGPEEKEQRLQYDAHVGRMQVQESARKKRGMFSLEVKGDMPITAITPTVMAHYQDMHYKSKLQKSDETQSTRDYETEFLLQIGRLPFETYRAFNLPASSDSSDNQELMLNNLGASLDVNIPTKGKTIGSGIINKIVYLHFKRALEMLNQDLDGEKLEDIPVNFEKRTLMHIQHLRDYGIKAIMANEQEQMDPKMSWEDLSTMITETRNQIVNTVNDLIDGKKVSQYPINPTDDHYSEKLRILGSVLGMMIKTEKRILLGYAILDKATEENTLPVLTYLRKLGDIEQMINAALKEVTE